MGTRTLKPMCLRTTDGLPPPAWGSYRPSWLRAAQLNVHLLSRGGLAISTTRAGSPGSYPHGLWCSFTLKLRPHLPLPTGTIQHQLTPCTYLRISPVTCLPAGHTRARAITLSSQ